MALTLRLSSKDRRAGIWPILLIDSGSNTVVSGHRTSGNAWRAAGVLNKLHGYARELSATQLHDLATAICERMYSQTEYDRLPPGRENDLVEAARMELRSRRRC